jgi:hypothetical protein
MDGNKAMKVVGQPGKYGGTIKATKYARYPEKLMAKNVERRSRLNDKLRFPINPHTGKARK